MDKNFLTKLIAREYSFSICGRSQKRCTFVHPRMKADSNVSRRHFNGSPPRDVSRYLSFIIFAVSYIVSITLSSENTRCRGAAHRHPRGVYCFHGINGITFNARDLYCPATGSQVSPSYAPSRFPPHCIPGRTAASSSVNPAAAIEQATQSPLTADLRAEMEAFIFITARQ